MEPAQQAESVSRIVARYRNEIMIARLSHERHILESTAINHNRAAEETKIVLYKGMAMALGGIVVAGAVGAGTHAARAATASRVARTERQMAHTVQAFENNAATFTGVQRVANAYASAKGIQNMAVSLVEAAPKGYAFATAIAGVSKFLVEGGDARDAIGSLFKAIHDAHPKANPIASGVLEIGLAYSKAIYRRQLIVGNTSNATNAVAHWSAKGLQGNLQRIYRTYEGAINRTCDTDLHAIIAD